MARISRSPKLKTLIGIIMTLIMVVSLFAGIGAIWVNRDADEVFARESVVNAAGVFTNPKTDKRAALGTAKNPFTVLEIVPNATMAQFGYLVEGQEPIDLLALATSDLISTSSTYKDLLEQYLSIEPTSSTPLCYEFDSLLANPHVIKYGDGKTDKINSDDASLVWNSDGNKRDQYGEYKANSKGDMALLETRTYPVVGYALLREKDIDASLQTIKSDEMETNELYKGTLINEDYSNLADVFNSKYHINYSAAKDPDHAGENDNIKVEEGGVFKSLYQKVEAGTGVYSRSKFVFNPDGGPYSLLYKYVGTNGNLDIADVPYKYVYRESSSGFVSGTEFVAFRRKKSGDEGKDTYNMVSGAYYNNNSNNKYYENKGTASDYDFKIDGFFSAFVEKVANDAQTYITSLSGNYTGDTVATNTLPTNIDAKGVTFSRGNNLTSKKPTGFDSATEFKNISKSWKANNKTYTDTFSYRYDTKYIYLWVHYPTNHGKDPSWNNSYYQYEYKKGSTRVQDYAEYYKFDLISNPGSPQTTSGGKYYQLVFEYVADGSGKFVVADFTKTNPVTKDAYMSYNKALKNNSWTWRAQDALGRMKAASNGKYKDISGRKEYLPQATFADNTEKSSGTMIPIRNEREFLGEFYEESWLGAEKLPKLADADDGSTVTYMGDNNFPAVVYSKDYDRFVLIPVLDIKLRYTYTFVPYAGVIESPSIIIKARYAWEGLDYYANLKVEADETERAKYAPPAFLSATELTKTPNSFKWVKADQNYSSAYKKSYTSNDLFKKQSVGLAYSGGIYKNSMEVDRYKFIGWFKDRYGVEALGTTEKLNSSTTLYAKWLVMYPDNSSTWDGFTVTFDQNIPPAPEPAEGEPEPEAENADRMPVSITNVSKNAYICAPVSIPTRSDYEFTGWYKDAECTEQFVFANPNKTENEQASGTDRITENTTLYAGWKPLGTDRYNIELHGAEFNLNPNYSVFIDPKQVVNGKNVAINGKRYYEKEELDEEGNPVYDEEGNPKIEQISYEYIRLPIPVCLKNGAETSDYEFAGWYTDEACTIRAGEYDSEQTVFLLDLNFLKNQRPEDVPENYSKSIDLYAKWIDTYNRPVYTVTLDANKPAVAVAGTTVEHLDNTTIILNTGATDETTGELIPAVVTKEMRPDPTMEGNVEARRKGYHVSVVTVTPEDLRIAANLQLITDADLIILNETCDDMLSDLWYEEQGDKYIFLKNSSDAAKPLMNSVGIKVPDKADLKKSFSTNDLSWDAVVKIMSRISGFEYVGNKSVAVATCPVLFDYNIYENCSKSNAVSFTTKTQDKKTITVSSDKSSNNNVYKLYLLTQLSSPVTMYNAFFTGRLDKTVVNGKLTPKAGGEYYSFTSTGSNDATEYWCEKTLIPYNVIDESEWNDETKRAKTLSLLGYNTNIGMADNTSLIKNRMFIYNNNKNLVRDYTAESIKSGDSGYDDIVALLGEPKNGKSAFQTGDVFYYMLHSDTLYVNLERDISVLEIQPYSYRHYDEYWFWYISCYAPNITGKISGVSMSSLEFQANIDDLNAKYDVIYLGTSNKIIGLNGDELEGINLDYDGDGKANNGLAYYHTGELCDPRWTDVSGHSHKSYYRVGTFNSVDGDGNIINDDITTLFASGGNDMTLEKYKDIAEFLNAGYPIIFDDDLISGDDANTAKLDRASWFYKLVHDVVTTKEKKGDKYYYTYNWYRESGPEAVADGTSAHPIQGSFYESLRHKTFALDFDYIPVEYYDKEKYSTRTDSPYINGDSGSDRGKELKYILRVNSVTGTGNYRLRLFVDTNGDGSYDPDDEKLDSVYIKNTDATMPLDRGEAASFVLTAGETYEVTREIVDYSGMIPWKVQVTELDSRGVETNVRDHLTGLSALSVAADQKEQIYILQITTDIRTSTDNQYVIMDGAGYQTEYVTNPGGGKGSKGDEGGKGDGGGGSKSGAKGEFANGRYAMNIRSTIYLPTDEEIKDVYYGTPGVAGKGLIEKNERGNTRSNTYFGTQNSLKLKNRYYNTSTKDYTYNTDYFSGNEYNYVFDSKECYWLDQNQYDLAKSIAAYQGVEFPYSLVQYRYQNASKFHYYTHNLNDFNVHFFRVSTAELAAVADDPEHYVIGRSYILKNGTYVADDVDGKGNNEVTWDNIDMIILGFGPGYDDITDPDSLDMIEEFIDAGKSALFTIDTTAYTRYSTSSAFNSVLQEFYKAHPVKRFSGSDVWWIDYWAGYNLTTRFADVIGQDKYGAFSNRGKIETIKSQLESALGTSVGSSFFEDITLKNVKNVGKMQYDIPFKTGNTTMTADRAGLATTGKVSRSGAIKETETASTTDIRVLVQGFSRSFSANNSNKLNPAVFDDVDKKVRTSAIATQTNDGQIVAYPYEIGTTSSYTGKRYMDISYATLPALQLNTEDDDVVVWFTLYSEADDAAKIVNDATNNYYIYSKKNVTYSGIGACQGVISDDECKLFVNTMLASYRAAAQATQPVVTNSDRSVSSDKDCLYVDYDASVKVDDNTATTPIGQDVITKKDADGNTFKLGEAGSETPVFYKRVNFELRNYSILMKKVMTVHYYPVVYLDNGDKEDDGITPKPVKVVLYDHPLVELDTKNTDYTITDTGTKPENTGPYMNTLETFRQNADPTKILSIRRNGNMDNSTKWTKPEWGTPILATHAASTDMVYPYKMPDGKSTKNSYVNRAVVGVGKEGVVSSLEQYFVDVPISDNYYAELFKDKADTDVYTYTYTKSDGSTGTGSVTWGTLKAKFGLDENSDFEIEIQVAMRYGKTHSKYTPLVGTRGVVFMKRGLFTLD